MRNFPYPDRKACRDELARDLHYHRIPVELREDIVDRAWQSGVDAANELMERHAAETGIREVAAKSGLSIKREAKDQVAGNMRYFSEYYSGRSQIILYTRSIALWAKENAVEQEMAEELILAHEYYHFLECTKLGLTSNQHKVVILRLGPLVLVRSGIRALSEIGAHGFARTYFHHRQSGIWEGDAGAILRNHAVNRREFEGKKMAAEIYSGKFLTKLWRRPNHGE